MTPLERFKAKVILRTDGCHGWSGSHDKDGYARFWVTGRTIHATRFLYETLHGPLAPGQQACHSCDFTGCVNDDHLFAGTQQENIQDCWAKGRGVVNAQPQRGERNGNNKLTEAQVLEIRARYQPGIAPHRSPTSLRSLAEEYGVSKFAISYALKGWTHLTRSSSSTTP